MIESTREKIKEDKPFAGFINIVHIKNLFPDTKSNFVLAHGGSFQIQDSKGTSYKLRSVHSIKTAERFERRVKLVPHIFPKFYGRDRNYLLFEFLEGRTLARNEGLDVFFEIGAMCGAVNKFKSDDKGKIKDEYYAKIRLLLEKKIIPSEDYYRILKIYEKLSYTIDHDVVLEIGDLKLKNLMVTPENRLCLIDQGALGYKVKGYGFVPFLLCVHSEEQRKSLLQGYNSVNSSAFMTKNYVKFITFLQDISTVIYESQVKGDYSNSLEKLLEF